MIVLAYFPPLWRRVMDHRVVDHYGGDLTLANIHPASATVSSRGTARHPPEWRRDQLPVRSLRLVYDERAGEPREGFAPVRAGPRSPTTGAAPTAESARRSTSSRWTRDRPPFSQAPAACLRDTVFDAVDDLVRERGWAATTMSDVAAAVGLSRQTLYNEFGSRAAFWPMALRCSPRRIAS